MGLDLRLLRLARSAGVALAATVCLSVGGALVILLQARQISRIVTRVFLDGQTLPQVLPLLGGLAAIFVARALLGYLAEGSAGEIAIRVKSSLREALLQKLFKLGPLGLQGQGGGSGDLTAATVQGIEALDAYFSQFLPQLALAALIPLSILVVVFPLDWLSGLVLLVTAPLIPIFMILIGQASQAVTRRQWTSLSRLSAFFLDTLQGLTTLKLLGRSREHTARIDRVSEEYRAATMNVLRVTFLSALALELVGTISTAVVAVEIGLRLLHAQLPFEQAFFILMIAPEFYWPLRQLGLRFHAGMSGVAAARQIFALLDAPEEFTTAATTGVGQGASAQIEALREIEFRQVSFQYPGREDVALENVSFSLRAGQHLAIVGTSGAGKTTLLQLLLRFIQPTGGQILINGRDLNEIPTEGWREDLAWVPQFPYLFPGSVLDNVRLGWPSADEETLRIAIDEAGLGPWLEGLPGGWHTPVGEQGAMLSGGQAQRVTLARAFVRNAPLLLLDEPTAHVDPELEEWLDRAIQQLGRGRTVVTAAHKLSTVAGADWVLVMEEGWVVEQGTPADLLAKGGAYARLVRACGGDE